MTAEAPIALITGFPGFLGERLLPRLIGLHPRTEFLSLVQSRFKDQALPRVGDDGGALPPRDGGREEADHFGIGPLGEGPRHLHRIALDEGRVGQAVLGFVQESFHIHGAKVRWER